MTQEGVRGESRESHKKPGRGGPHRLVETLAFVLGEPRSRCRILNKDGQTGLAYDLKGSLWLLVENRLSRRMGEGRDPDQCVEALAIIEAGEDGSRHQAAVRWARKWLDSGHNDREDPAQCC